MREFVKDHPGAFISFSYAFGSIIGLVYLYGLYSEFGINIFDFVKASDYLTAMFREVPLLILGIYLMVLFVVGTAFKGNLNNRYSPLSRNVRQMIFLFLLLMFLTVGYPIGLYRADTIINGESTPVTFKTRFGNEGREFDEKYLIGATERFMFFYDGELVEIIPLTNIIEVSHAAPGWKREFIKVEVKKRKKKN